MVDERDRCAEYEEYKRIDAAFRAGDLAALEARGDREIADLIRRAQ